MRVIDEVDLIGDPMERRAIGRLSWIILCLGIATLAAVASQSLPSDPGGTINDIGWGIIAGLVATIPHELIHGATFKILGPSGSKVSFGFKAAFFYTRYHGPALKRDDFLRALLAPAVILSIALPVLGAALGHPLAGWLAMVLHLSGCAGDIVMSVDILAMPGVTHVEDTDAGCRLLGE